MTITLDLKIKTQYNENEKSTVYKNTRRIYD